MDRLNIAKLKAGIDLLTKEIDVPELGGSVVIRAVTIDERNQMIAYGKDAASGDSKHTRALLLYGVHDPKFTEADLDALLPILPAVAVTRIVTAITIFNGWTPEAEQALKNSFR